MVAQGCRAYGHPLTVTRSDRNVIYEVAGVPAMECLVDQIKDSLGPVDIAGIESNGLLMGRLIDEHVDDPGPGDYLIRKVVGVDRSTGAVAVEDRVPLGSTIRFHVRDARGGPPRAVPAAAKGRHAEAVLLFTCNGRGTRLFDDSHHDAGVLRAVTRSRPGDRILRRR